MQINVSTNIPAVQAALKQAAAQVPYALSTAINKTLAHSRSDVQTEAAKVFDRPTPWVLNSVRVKYATKAKPEGSLSFKDKDSVTNSRTMVEPHVYAGKRHFKAFEARLQRIGLLPAGYNAVPGEGARLDAYGNMSQGQISQILNVLGAYTESGFNKANVNTVKRLAKGNAKKGVMGFVYWVNKVGSTKAKHLPPGVYQRVTTAFGSSLKPVLIFVKQANYKKTLQFYEVAQRSIDRHFPGYFDQAWGRTIKTALLKDQGALL